MADRLQQAVILAGGLALRMARLFPGRAKATFPLKGRRMLHHLFDWIEHQGLQRVHLCLGHLKEQVVAALPVDARLTVTYTVELHPLGVAGALRLAVPALDSAFVLMYCDVLPRVDLEPVQEVFQRRGADIQLTVCSASRTSEPPNVLLEGGRVLAYGPGAPVTHLDIGLTLMRRHVVEQLPTDRFVSSSTMFEMALANGRLGAVEVDTPSLEIGSPEGYRRACREMALAR